MPKTIRLSDLQFVLLTHAAGRSDDQLIPFPPSASDPRRTTRACRSLLRRGLVAEVAVTRTIASWRTADDQHIRSVLTKAGLSAIGVDTGTGIDACAAATPSPALAPSERKVSKIPEQRPNAPEEAALILTNRTEEKRRASRRPPPGL